MNAIRLFPEHARLLGCIVAETSSIEFALVNLLARSLNTTEDIIFPMVYAIASTRARLDAMAAVFTRVVKGEARLEEIREMLKEADTLLRLRNNYAHALFVGDREGRVPFVTMVTKLGAEAARSRRLEVAELERDLVRMRALSERVYRLTTEIVFETVPTVPAETLPSEDAPADAPE